ncbi:MAG: zinc ribbon domain-containing protein [Butyrivibrio sp.]|nr:zinc ribbon domain-containing protein [Butyrivibrio sp.]
MKICPNCGTELPDNAAFCSYCGTGVAATDSFSQGAFSGQAQYQAAPQAQNSSEMQFHTQVQPETQNQVKGFDPNAYNAAPAYDTANAQVQYYNYHDNPGATYRRDEGLATAIKVFMVIGCVLSINFLCIPLIWKIPMTIHAFKKLNNDEAMGTGFKVCSLLFCNMIAGIMMFIIKDEDMPYQR